VLHHLLLEAKEKTNMADELHDTTGDRRRRMMTMANRIMNNIQKQNESRKQHGSRSSNKNSTRMASILA